MRTKKAILSAEESISIMVYQELRFDLGKIEIMPDTLVVGDDANNVQCIQ